MEWQISNATLVYRDQVEKAVGLHIEEGIIQKRFGAGEAHAELANLNLNGLFVFHGLINSHDSLIASCHAFRGANHPYNSWITWDNELKSSPLFRQRMLLDPAHLYQIGSYRNILSGVTTIVDHVPHTIRKPFEKQVLPFLLSDFGISHSLCSYSLGWGNGIRQEYEYAVQNDLPYIIHIAEGFDLESRSSLQKLMELGVLGKHTVLVHGLSLSLHDLDSIAKAEAHLVWCPVSNWHIFQKMAPIKEALERGINVSIGTDSAMSGSRNLLHDIRFAQECYQKRYVETLEPSLLLKMVTTNPEKAFRIEREQHFTQGSPADFIVLKGKYPSAPLASFAEADLEEIYLVVLSGEPVYGHVNLEKIFLSCGIDFERFHMNSGGDEMERIVKRHNGDHMQSLEQLFQRVDFAWQRSLDFLPIMTK